MRVKRGTIRARKRTRLLKRVKGYRWRRKNTVRMAKTAILKAGVMARRDRRAKKGDFRRLWNVRLNAAGREHGLSYSRLIGLLKKSNIDLDRKILSDLAITEPETFKAIVDKAKSAQ